MQAAPFPGQQSVPEPHIVLGQFLPPLLDQQLDERIVLLVCVPQRGAEVRGPRGPAERVVVDLGPDVHVEQALEGGEVAVADDLAQDVLGAVVGGGLVDVGLGREEGEEFQLGLGPGRAEELVRHAGRVVHGAAGQAEDVRLVEDGAGLADLQSPEVEPDGDFQIGVGVGRLGRENEVPFPAAAVAALVELGPAGEALVEVGEPAAIPGGEDEVLALVADGMLDVLALALAHQRQRAPAALEDVRLEVPALRGREGEEVQRRGQEVRGEEAMAGALVGAAEGQADEPGVDERVGEGAGDVDRGPREVDLEAFQKDLLDELDGERLQTGQRLGSIHPGKLWRKKARRPSAAVGLGGRGTDGIHSFMP